MTNSFPTSKKSPLTTGCWATCRWGVDISRWTPSEEEFTFLCSHLLQKEEEIKCRKFRFEADRKRALVSKLLQRSLGMRLFKHVAPSQYSRDDLKCITMDTTKGGKPYVVTTGPCEPEGAVWDAVPNFNFSSSHDGHYVVVASEGVCICGCDISSPGSIRRKKDHEEWTVEGLKQTFRAFERQLTRKEWARVYESETSVEAMERRFTQFWSLKEAFVKATGMGLGYDLGKIEFDICDDTNTATVWIEGKGPSREWSFHLHELAHGHWVSVAKGPPKAVVDAKGGFKATFRRPILSSEELHQSIHGSREPPFDLMTVADLVPDHLQDEYEKLVHILKPTS